jgi:hypothetical protein
LAWVAVYWLVNHVAGAIMGLEQSHEPVAQD